MLLENSTPELKTDVSDLVVCRSLGLGPCHLTAVEAYDRLLGIATSALNADMAGSEFSGA